MPSAHWPTPTSVPLVTAAFESGTIGRENIGGQQDSAGLKVEAVPVRYKNEVVAVLTHQTALGRPQGQPAGERLPRLRR